MIFWFSGTGNSKHVAHKLSAILNEPIEFIPKHSKKYKLKNEEKLLFVFPVYSWGIPPIVLDFIDILELENFNNNYISMICTCGDEVAKSPEMFIKAFSKKGIRVNSIFSVIMPNNYVLLPGFSVDPKDVEQSKLENAPQRIEFIASQIEKKIDIIDVTRGSIQLLKSKLIYPLFKKWGVFPSKWKVSNDCIGCGLCEQACPINNIKLDDNNKPKWGKNCVSCVACYHICPKNAIQYGSITKNKGQYFFDKNKPMP